MILQFECLDLSISRMLNDRSSFQRVPELKMYFTNIVLSVFFTALISYYSPLRAQSVEWSLEQIETPQTVTEIFQASPSRVLIKAGLQWYLATWCGDEICLKPGAAPEVRKVPEGGLPDGGMAVFKSPEIVSAWYSQPTRRYDHGVLGDAIEAGGLSARDAAGNLYNYQLPDTSVFEDITPRLADLNGDGRPEIITIRSYLNTGASLAVFSLRDGRLEVTAATSPIGQPNRWLNIAGIEDFNGDGSIDIAIVVTPHIGGTLEIWSYTGEKLIKTASEYGFSNHFIGSRNLDLSAVGDVNRDTKPDIAIPGAARRQLRIMSLQANRLSQTGAVDLPDKIVANIGLLRHPGGAFSAYLLGLANGALVAAVNRP